MKKAPEWTIQEKQRERIATLEAELEAAAKILQAALPIGQVKAIGLLEVAEGVRMLAEIAKPWNPARLANRLERMQEAREVLAQVSKLNCNNPELIARVDKWLAEFEVIG